MKLEGTLKEIISETGIMKYRFQEHEIGRDDFQNRSSIDKTFTFEHCLKGAGGHTSLNFWELFHLVIVPIIGNF